jgi:hypothetical protein
MADSVFIGFNAVDVAAAGGLSGDGTAGDPLAVNVDGTTIEINGSNDLALTGQLPNDSIIDVGTGTANAGVGGGIVSNLTTTQTGANTNETDLWTYTLPANSLTTDGWGVRVTAYGSFGANATNKILKVYFGGTAIGNTGPGAANNLAWEIVMVMWRTGASTQKGYASTRASNFYQIVQKGTASADLTASVEIKITGTNSAANAGDIVKEGALVEFFRVA